jgi:hypothetical protein
VFCVYSALIVWAAAGMRAGEPAPDPKLVDSAKMVLSSLAFSEPRQLALLELDQPELTRALARNERDLEVRRIATLLLTDQDDLKQQAVAPYAVIREAAVTCITDEAFLLHRLLSREEPSPAVRSAIVWTLRTQGALAEAAQGAYDRDVREAAAKRVTDPDLSAKVQAAQEAIECDEMAIARGEAAGGLVNQALNGAFDVLRLAAAKKLRSQDDIATVALAPADHAVHKVVFGKLTDPALLKKVAAEAADPVMRLAAAYRTGSQDFDHFLKEAHTRLAVSDTSPGHAARLAKALAPLGNAAAAFSLFDEAQSSASESIRWASGMMMVAHDESRIVEMIELFALYGNQNEAHCYSISGQPDWEDAGNDWFNSHGFKNRQRNGARPAKQRKNAGTD